MSKPQGSIIIPPKNLHKIKHTKPHKMKEHEPHRKKQKSNTVPNSTKNNKSAQSEKIDKIENLWNPNDPVKYPIPGDSGLACAQETEFFLFEYVHFLLKFCGLTVSQMAKQLGYSSDKKLHGALINRIKLAEPLTAPEMTRFMESTVHGARHWVWMIEAQLIRQFQMTMEYLFMMYPDIEEPSCEALAHTLQLSLDQFKSFINGRLKLSKRACIWEAIRKYTNFTVPQERLQQASTYKLVAFQQSKMTDLNQTIAKEKIFPSTDTSVNL